MTNHLIGWATTDQVDWIKVEFARGNDRFGTMTFWFDLVLAAFAVFGLLINELWITLPELIVRDVAINLILMQIGHVGFIGKACVCGHDDACLINICVDAQAIESVTQLLKNWLQGVVFLTMTKGLCIHNDLMLFIDACHAVVTLNGAFAGGHLGALVVGQIAFDFGRSLTLSNPGLL